MLDVSGPTIPQPSTNDMDTTLTTTRKPIGNVHKICGAIVQPNIISGALSFVRNVSVSHFLSLAASCSWSTPTNQSNLLQCNDGTYCNGLNDGWACCNSRGMRRKCPLNYPTMCANPDCSGGDYCCFTKDDCVAKAGGIRSCDNPGRSLFSSPCTP